MYGIDELISFKLEKETKINDEECDDVINMDIVFDLAKKKQVKDIIIDGKNTFSFNMKNKKLYLFVEYYISQTMIRVITINFWDDTNISLLITISTNPDGQINGFTILKNEE